jgi:predicted ATPase
MEVEMWTLGLVLAGSAFAAKTEIYVTPRLVVVATSREVLKVAGERAVPVPPLRPGPALALFEALARAARPDLDLTACRAECAEIVDCLEGIPLALELVAARVRGMNPRQILERLDRILDSPAGRRDLAPRHATLRATFDDSWGLLSPAEQRALAQCSVFHGGFDLEAAEAVLDLGPDALWVPDVVQELVDRSLLRIDPSGRYRILEVVREYAAEHLDPTEREASLDRHQAHYFAATSDADSDLENQIVATSRAMRSGDVLVAAQAACRLGRLFTVASRGPTG